MIPCKGESDVEDAAHDHIQSKRESRSGGVRAGDALSRGSPRGMRRRVGQGRVRAGRHLRLLPDAGRWISGAVVPAEAGADGRTRRGHRRGSARGHTPHPERSIRARRRRAVRVLHSGNSDPRRVVDPARADERPKRGREGPRRASLPLHRLRPDHRLDSDRRRSLPQRRTPAERPTATPFVLRRRVRAHTQPGICQEQRQDERGRHRPIDRAPRRTGAVARRNAFRRRHARARHAARGDGPDRSPASEDSED